MSIPPQAAPASSTSAPPTWNFSPAILAVWLVGFIPLESAPMWIPAGQIHYHVTAVAMGGIASLQFLAAAATAMFIAPHLGKLPLRIPMLAVMSAALLAALATATLHPIFPAFIALRVMDGMTAGLCVACGAILANRTPRPSRSFGALQFGQIIANMLIFSASTGLAVTYGLAGVYALLSAGILIMIVVVLLHPGWSVAILPRAAAQRADRGRPNLRLILGCIAIAVVYAGFIGMVTNATALGARAGIGFARITILLAITTPASALGALLATLLAGRISGAALVATGVIGAAAAGLFLILAAYNFTTLTLAICGIIFFIYIAFPSLYAAISKLDLTGRAAATAQSAQMLGPVFGPAIGALIAVHSVTGLATAVTLAIAGGIALACLAVWPVLTRELAPEPGEVSESVTSLPSIV